MTARPENLERDGTVLIVDDEPCHLSILSDLMRQSSYRVLVARSGAQALHISNNANGIDMVLLDVEMPLMNGYETMGALRGIPHMHETPIILVTANSTPEDEQLGLSLGAADYIRKPIRPGIVVARVQRQMALKRDHDSLLTHNSHLECEVKRRASEHQKMCDMSLNAMMRLAEKRDIETIDHSRRTQEYVRILAQDLKTHPRFADCLSEEAVDLLVKSAPLHDIGKVGVPDSILLKPGALTQEERTIMESHCALGADAISKVSDDASCDTDFLRVAKNIARSHHERWDGRGYPDKLSGDAIPIEARLMAIADVFDALTTARPYKEPFPVDTAIEMIKEGRGTQFDPDVTDALLRRVREFKSAISFFGLN